MTHKCLGTRTTHYDVPPPEQECRATRNSHHPKTNEGEEVDPRELSFVVNDEIVPPDTDIFMILQRAWQLIEV